MIHFDADTIRMVLETPDRNMNGYPHSKIIWRMLQALYSRQTSQEQSMQATVENNGMGFNGFDATFLSDVAEKSQQYKNLTPRQAAVVAKKLKKYIRQLVEIANELQPEKAPAPKRSKRQLAKEDPSLFQSWGGQFQTEC